MEDNEQPEPMGQVTQIDEARIKEHLGEPGLGIDAVDRVHLS